VPDTVSHERTPTEPPASRDQVQSLVRGLSVIRAFGVDTPQLTLSEVAQRSGLTRAAARRFILTLVALGYLETDGRLFRLTPRVLDLGYSYLSSQSIPEVARPHIEALVAKVEESSEIAVLDGDEVVYILRITGPRILTTAISIGTRLPAHVTSLGRVMLAGLEPEQLEEYLATAELRKVADRTLTDRDALRTELELVARRGWALVDSQLEEGLLAVGVPIRDRTGRIIAAVNLSTHPTRRSLGDLEEILLTPLLETVREIEIDLRISGADLHT
jgi:IclR family pca regulon transcriptional regulator